MVRAAAVAATGGFSGWELESKENKQRATKVSPEMSPKPAPKLAVQLQAVPIFGGLTADTLDFLLTRGARVEVDAGAYFFHQDEPGDALYVLERGRVAIVRSAEPSKDGERTRRFLLRELGPGDCFGEMSLLAVLPRSAAVRALEPCQAVRIRNRDLFDLYEHDVGQFAMLVMNLGREVSRRLYDTDARLFQVLPKGALTEDAEAPTAADADPDADRGPADHPQTTRGSDD